MELRLAALLFAFACIGIVSAGPRRDAASPADDQLVDLLKDICSEVTDEVRDHVPAKFAELVHSLKSLPHATIARVHKQVSGSGFCASSKLVDLWNDALIMDASEGSLKLIADQIIRKEVSPSRANYLFTMMAFSRNPTSGAVRAVLPILEEKEVPRQALLGISALVRNANAGRPQFTSETRDAVKAIVKYMDRNIKHQDRLVVALKALQNIEAIDEAMDKVIRLATDSSQKSGVRVAAIEALRAHAARQQVTQKCMEIFQNSREPSEIRIAAYKVVIESRDRQIVQRIVQTIRREDNKQVGAFVSTHLKNLRDSSSPRHEAVQQLLQDEKIPTERFPQDLRKYSRNFEISQYIERLGFGGVLDTDLIYDKSFAPRSVKMNLTVPISEGELNMFEFGFRQVGLEEEMRKLIGPHLKGRNAPEILTEVLAEIVDLFDQESSNEIQSGRFARKVQKKQNIFSRVNSKEDVEAAFYFNVDGKTIAYFDIADLTRPENDMSQAIRSVMQEVRRTEKVDRAYAFMFMKKEFEVPSKEGKTPVAVNGTVIFGLKGDKNSFVPSIAVEMSTRTSDKKYQQRISTSADLRFDVEYKNDRPVKVALKLPKESQKLIHVSTAVFDVDKRGVETPSSASYQKISKCTTSLTRPFGLEFCATIATPDEMLANGIPPFNGLWEVELVAMKTDRQMSGWEFALETPQAGAAEQTYRVAFDTPNSRVGRRQSLLLRSYDQSRGLQLKLESPFASLDASASYVMSNSQWGAKSELKTGDDKYSFEAGLSRSTKGKKQEWIPVLRVSAPDMTPIALTGEMSLNRGRKTQLSFELRCENDDKRFLKGSVMQEGAIALEKDFRLSSDVQADLGPISFRVFSSAEQQANSISTDLKIDYQTPNSRKHTVKVVSKLHNLSTASYAKVNSFIEAQMSQYPEKNFHVSWNVLVKPQEHLENELTVMWSDQMRDQNKKIHILQVSKATGLAAGRAVTAENILSVEIAPIHFKYEFKAAGSMERSQTPKYKVQLEMNNKNQKSDDVQASFEVQHVSSEPFKMTIDAALITAARELRYSDKVEEVSPRVYKGRTLIQWQQDKKTTIGYTLKVKSDRQKTELEMDAEIKTPSMRHGLRHQGALRASRSDLNLQSKVFYEKSNIWDLEAKLQRQGKSHARITMKGLEVKGEANLSTSPRNIMIDVKGNDFSHLSTLLMSKDAITLTSKSMSEQKPVLVINARKNGKDAVRVNMECTMFDARVELSGRGDSPATAAFDFRGKSGNKLALKTKASFSVSEGVELSGECKSESYAPHSANLKIARSARGINVAVRSEHNGKEWHSGKALLEEIATGLRATAQLSKWGSQVGRFQSTLHRQVLAGPHDVEINFRPESSSQTKTLKIHHEIANGEAKCVFTYLEDGVQKGQLENFGVFKSSRSELQVAAGVTLKSEVQYHGLDGVHVSFDHRHKNERRSFQSETRVKGQFSDEQKYELALTSERSGDRKDGKAAIKLALDTPIYDFKQQSSAWTAQWTSEKISLNHKTTARNVNILLETNIQKSEIFNGPHDLKIEYTVPRYAPWSVKARHAIVNGNLRSSAEYQVNGRKQLSAQAVGQLKRRNGQIDFAGPHEVEVKLQTPSSDEQSLKWYHDAKSSEFKCRLTHTIAGEEKQSLENQATFQCPAPLDCQFSANLVLKSKLYPELDGYSAKLEHKHKISRKNLQASSSITAERADDKYHVSATCSGKGDAKQGEFIVKAKAETPVARYEKQAAELTYRWSRNEVTVDTNVQASEVNIKMKMSANRNVISGPHDLVLEFEVPKIRPFSVEAKHQISAGVSKTNVEIKELKNQKVILGAAAQMQQRGDRITVGLDGEIREKRFSHESEVLAKADQLSLDSKTHWENRQIATIKVRFYQKQPSFAEIDCPIFQLRADADTTTSTSTAAFDFKSKTGNKLALKTRGTLSLSEGLELTGECKSQSSAPHSASLKVKRSAQGVSVAVRSMHNNKEWLSGKAGLENVATGLRANAELSKWGSEVGRFQSQLHRQVLDGPHDVEINYRLEPSSRMQTLKIHHEIANGEAKCKFTYLEDGVQKGQLENFGVFKSSRSGIEVAAGITLKSEVKYNGLDGVHFSIEHRHQKERLSFQSETRVKGQVSDDQKYEFAFTTANSGDRMNGKSTAKVVLETPVDDFKRQSSESTIQWTEEKIALNQKISAKNVNIFFETSIRKSDIANGPHDLKIEYAISQSTPWSVIIRHEIVDGNLKSSAEHQANGQNKLSAQAVGQLKRKNGQIDFAGPHEVEIRFQTPSSDAQSLKWFHEAKNNEFRVRLAHLIAGVEKQRLENQARFQCSGPQECKFSSELVLKSKLYPNLDGYKANLEHDHQFNRINWRAESKLIARQANDKYQMDWALFANKGKLTVKATAESPIANYEKQMAELNCRWSNEKITIDHKVQASEVNIVVKANVNRNLISGPHDLNVDFDIPRMQPISAAVKHQASASALKTNVEIKELKNQKVIFGAAAQMQQRDDRITVGLDGEIREKRFSHESEVLAKADQLSLDSKTHWENRQIATIKVRFYQKQPSFVEIDCSIFQLRADADVTTSPSTAAFDFKSKTGNKLALKTRGTLSLSEGLELTGECKSQSSAPHSAYIKVTRSARGVSVMVRSMHNKREWLSGKAGLEEDSNGLRANAELSKWGSQVGRFQSQVDRQIFSGPHDMEINYRPDSSSQMQTLKLHHELANGKVNSSVFRMVDGKKRPIGDVSGRGFLDAVAGLYMKA